MSARGQTAPPLRVLLLEDAPDDAALLVHELEAAGYAVRAEVVDTREEYLAALRPDLDLILADHALPRFDALQALDLVRGRRLGVPFIIVSGAIQEETAVEAMRRGAADYLLKDRLARLGPAVERAIRARQYQREKARAAAAIRASEEQLRRILESITDAFYALDPEWRFTYVNREAERQFGRSRDELLGGRLWDVFPHTRGTPFQTELRRAARDGVAVRFTSFYAPAEAWFTVRAYPYADGLSVFFADVTARKRDEAQLRLLQQAAEASTGGLIVTDATHPDAPVLYVNPAFTTITGFAPEEVIGRNCRFLQGADREQPALAELRRALRERRPAHVVLRNYRKDGSLFWNELHLAPVEAPDGRLVNYVGVINDVTERVDAEGIERAYAAQLRALSHRLVEVQEQERRALALELHDEIGQVLTALKLTLDAAGRSPAQAGALLGDARAIVQRLQSQVRNLSLDLRPSMLDDLGLVPALVWLFERAERRMGLAVRFERPEHLPELPADVATTAYRIAQEALTNVARHAGVTEADVRLGTADHWLVLEVADCGAGFDRSARAAEPSSGLPGMSERATLLGGMLEVDARPGEGTRVRVRLPLDPPTP